MSINDERRNFRSHMFIGSVCKLSNGGKVSAGSRQWSCDRAACWATSCHWPEDWGESPWEARPPSRAGQRSRRGARGSWRVSTVYTSTSACSSLRLLSRRQLGLM